MTVRLMAKPTASAALARRAAWRAWVTDPAVHATVGSRIITARAAIPRSAATSRQVSTTCLRQPNAPAARARYIRSSSFPRSYHSYDHPPNPNPFTETEQALLSAAYVHVPEHGFTQQALAQGARDAGYLDISPSILPDGPFALIRWHLVTQRLALADRRKELFGTDKDPSDVDRKVAALAWARLQGNEAVIGKWQEALSVMAQPSYMGTSVKELALLADEILFLAGETSVDPSWYTKRAALSTIYASSELFMTNDTSNGFRDTQAFLCRRLEESRTIGGIVHNVRRWLGFTARAGVNVLRSKGVKI